MSRKNLTIATLWVSFIAASVLIVEDHNPAFEMAVIVATMLIAAATCGVTEKTMNRIENRR